MKTMTDAIQTITAITVKKWFDGRYGNTYHNVTVTGKDAEGNLVSESTGKTYGYGEHWRQTFEEFSERCEIHGIELSVVDVKSERSLYNR